MSATSLDDRAELAQLVLDEFAELDESTLQITYPVARIADGSGSTVVIPSKLPLWIEPLSAELSRLAEANQDYGTFYCDISTALPWAALQELGGSRAFYQHLILEHGFRIEVDLYVLTNHVSASSLSPRVIRRLVEALKHILLPPGTYSRVITAHFAFACRAIDDAVLQLARKSNAEGALLWLYHYPEEEFRDIAGYGPVGSGYVLHLGGVRDSSGRVLGIVSQARPEIPLVTYSIGDPTVRTPDNIENWFPHDPQVLDKNKWDSCVSWPIVSDGDLLGALSLYSTKLDDLVYSPEVRIAASLNCAEYLRDLAWQSELRDVERLYEAEIARNSYGRLATELVHDYKSGLESVELLVTNLREDSLSEGMKRVYREAAQTLPYLRKVTSTLSTLSRGVRTGSTCDLREVLEVNEEFLRALVSNESRRARIEIRYPHALSGDQSCSVNMDALTALRVLSNLVQNAAIWTKGEPTPHIVVRLSPAELKKKSDRREPDPVRLVVSDNGPGVDGTIKGRIFERGFSNRKEDGGSGLGLYIVEKAVEASGGSITVTGRRGEGARFILLFPPRD